MATDPNHVTIVGRLGRDPELKLIGNNETHVCNFSIAVNESFKDSSGEWKERTDWFEITVWGNQAKACGENLAKGSKVLIMGKLTQNRWEKDGQKHSKVLITARSVTFMGAKPNEGMQPKSSAPAAFHDVDFGGDDDIPF